MPNPPKPTALRKLQGNPGKRPLNAREPRPTVLIGAEPPAWLSPEARKAWRAVVPKLCASRVLTEADLQALSMMFDAYGEWWAARKVVREEGMVFKVTEVRTDADGTRTEAVVSVRRRPEVAIAADAFRRVRLMMGDFGMTPASRVRLVAGDEAGAEDDPFESWLGRSG